MATATIIARKPLTIGTDTTTPSNSSATPLISITVDAAPTETHTLSNTVTDFPVEDGVNFTDHSRPNPDTLQLDCIISNTPLSQQQATTGVQTENALKTSQTTGAVQLGAANGYAQQAYQKLKQLRDQGVLCTIVTNLRTYTSMMIENISIPRDAKSYDGLKFSISFKLVRVVQNKLTRVVVAKAKNVGPKIKTGAQTPTDSQGVEESSSAFDLKEKLSGLPGQIQKKLGFGGQ